MALLFLAEKLKTCAKRSGGKRVGACRPLCGMKASGFQGGCPNVSLHVLPIRKAFRIKNSM